MIIHYKYHIYNAHRSTCECTEGRVHRNLHCQIIDLGTEGYLIDFTLFMLSIIRRRYMNICARINAS